MLWWDHEAKKKETQRVNESNSEYVIESHHRTSGPVKMRRKREKLQFATEVSIAMLPPPPPIPEVTKVQVKVIEEDWCLAKRVTTKLVRQRVETRVPDMRRELRRGGLKEKWGISLIQRIGEGGRVELCVSKVVKFSPAEKVFQLSAFSFG